MLPIPKRIRYPLAPWAPSPQPPEEPWNTHSGLNTGHSLLIISTGPGYDYPHFTEEETKAQTCPPYALAKQQMKAHQGLADPKPALSWTPSSSCCTALGFLVPPPLGPAPCGRLLWDWVLLSPGLAGRLLHPAPTLGLTPLSEGRPTLPALAPHSSAGFSIDTSHPEKPVRSEQVSQQVILPLTHLPPHTDSPVDIHACTHMETYT